MLPRVLALSSSNGNGGAERHTVTLAAAYQAHGGWIQLACPTGSFMEQESQGLSLPTAAFHPRNSGDLRAVLRLVRLARATSAQVLHSHARRDFVTATLAGKLARCPVILHVHVVRPLGEPRRLAGHFFNRVNAIVAVSEYAQKELQLWHPLRPGLVRRLYNGIDVNLFSEIPQGTLRSLWQVPPGGQVIGMVGRLSTKGQQTFLPVAAQLAEQFPDLRFVFAGPDDPKLTLQDFQKQIDARGLSQKTVLMGISDRIPEVMRSLDILVHLPLEEAFGLALVEAAAAHVPVVSHDIGGCTEVVEEAKTGFLVRVGDATALQQRLHRLLTEPELRRCMGHAGQLRARLLFSAKRQINELCALYEEVSR